MDTHALEKRVCIPHTNKCYQRQVSRHKLWRKRATTVSESKGIEELQRNVVKGLGEGWIRPHGSPLINRLCRPHPAWRSAVSFPEHLPWWECHSFGSHETERVLHALLNRPEAETDPLVVGRLERLCGYQEAVCQCWLTLNCVSEGQVIVWWESCVYVVDNLDFKRWHVVMTVATTQGSCSNSVAVWLCELVFVRMACFVLIRWRAEEVYSVVNRAMTVSHQGSGN